MATKNSPPDPLQVCSFRPVQELYVAAREIALCSRIGDINCFDFELLRRVVAKVEEAARESDSLVWVREWARNVYIDASCDIDIDDANFTHPNGSGGYWVGAWLWVPEDAAVPTKERGKP